MNLPSNNHKRRSFKWSKEARDLVRTYLATGGPRHKLIDALAQISGHPRNACIRFARQIGVTARRPYKKWGKRDIEILLQLCEQYPLRTVALKLHRPETAVRGMLQRLGFSAKMGKDSFTKYVLAQLLHVRPHTIQRWIDQGLLRFHLEGTERLPRVVITADDFIDFCKKHPEAILQNRFSEDRLEFIFKFVFPRSHVDLLPVREAKKERAAYAAQMLEQHDDCEDENTANEFRDSEKYLGLTA